MATTPREDTIVRMKSFLALSCLLAVVVSVYAASEDFKEKIKAAKEACAKEFTIDAEAMKKVWHERTVPDDKNLLCYTGCMFNHFGLIKDHKYNVEAALAKNKMKYTGEDLEKADKIARACEKEVPTDLTDDCDLAKKMLTCYFNGLKEHGIGGN